MSLKERITSDMKQAMKSGDTERLSVLRMLRSATVNAAIDRGKKEEGLGDEEVVEVLTRAAKQRREAAEGFVKAGREEQAAAERREEDIIRSYLPEQMNEDEIRSVVRVILKEKSATGAADMGVVMGAVMSKVKGRADGNVVRSIVEEELKN